MKKMGWKEGTGLGKDGQGVTDNLRAVRRAEELGIGATVDHAGEGWGRTGGDFQDALKKLNEKGGEGKEARRKKRKFQKLLEKNKRKMRGDDSSRPDGEGGGTVGGGSGGGGREEANGTGNGAGATDGLMLSTAQVQVGHAKKMRKAKSLTGWGEEEYKAVFGKGYDATATATATATGGNAAPGGGDDPFQAVAKARGMKEKEEKDKIKKREKKKDKKDKKEKKVKKKKEKNKKE